MIRFTALLCAVLTGACSDDEPRLGAWDRCDFTLDGTAHPAECLRIRRPARSDAAAALQIEVHVQRVRAPGGARGQLWLLQGGPGGSGASLRPLAVALHDRGLDLDVYLPDHRGTGASTPLSCGGATTLEACGQLVRAAWGASLDGFSTTEAAHDLAAQIDAAREGDGPVFVWGGSYGTTWGHRYLQLHPAQPAGVILDSVCAGKSCELANFDRNVDAGVRHIFDACAADAQCHARLPDPLATLDAVLARGPTGSCPLTRDPAAVRQTLALVAMIAPTLLPAAIHRVDRCSAADVAAADTFQDRLTANRDPGFSLPLQLHVLLSEMWPDVNPELAAEEAFERSARVSPGASPTWIALHDAWPRYTPPPLADQVVDTTVPLLVTSGTWDLQTPLELSAEIAGALHGASQHHVVIPGGGHGLLLKNACVTEIVFAFLDDPTAPLDTSCADEQPPPDFFDDALAARLFGRGAWD